MGRLRYNLTTLFWTKGYLLEELFEETKKGSQLNAHTGFVNRGKNYKIYKAAHFLTKEKINKKLYESLNKSQFL